MRYVCVCSEPEAKGFIAAVAILYFPTHMNCSRVGVVSYPFRSLHLRVVFLLSICTYIYLTT